MPHFTPALYRTLTALALLGTSAMAGAQLPVFTTDDTKQPYFSFSIDQDQLNGAPDRSQMNAPLTAADRVFVRDGHFYRIGGDGKTNTPDDTRVRLYGANLSFATNFPSEQDAVRMAKRLRKLGFNAVRLHHMDTSPGTQTNPPRSLLTPGPYPTFNQAALDRLSQFIRILAKEGIYVNINLHVSYSFRASVDQVPAFENNAGNETYGSSVHAYYPRMVNLQEQFARQLLRALNLRGFPGLAMVEINNESSLLAAWQRREWKATVPPNYEAELQRQWQQWLTTRYGSTDKACAAWGECVKSNGGIALLTPTDSTYLPNGVLSQLQTRIENKLRPITQKFTGPSDPGTPESSGQARRVYDFLQFLADTDRTYFNRMRKVVQEETDTLVPVTGTQMGYGGVLNFDSHAQMDYIDEHFYIDHPDYPGTSFDRNDWRMRDAPLNTTDFNRLLHLSYKRDRKKPFVISEFNYPFPNRYGAVIQPLMAAYAAAQDWDGLFIYEYMDGDNWANTPTPYALSGDWGKFALTGQSALLFRASKFPALRTQITVPMTIATREAIAASKDPSAWATHLEVRYGLTPQTASTARINVDLTGTATLAATKPVTTIKSPDNSIEFTAQDLLILRAPQAKGVFGTLPQGAVTIDNGITVQQAGKGRGYVALLLSTLDNQPVERSRQLLLTISGAVTGTQEGSMPARPKQIVPYKGQSQWYTFERDADNPDKPSGLRDVSGPVWMERTQVQLTLPVTGTIAVYPLDGQGTRLAAIPAQQISIKDGVATIALQASEGQTSLWYEIIASAP